MSRIRLFTLLTGSFLLASAAWADDLGYVDCAAHPESTQVFAKPRQTPDSIATVVCGERFTILLNGFIFSRVQTKDGKVGYVYSSVITVDHGQAGPPQSSAGRAPAASVAAAPATNMRPAVANAATAAPAYPQSSSSAQASSTPVTTSLPPEKPAASSAPLFPTPPMPAVTAADVNYSSQVQAAPAASSAPVLTPAASAASVQAASAASQPSAAAPAPSATPSAPVSASIAATASISASTPAPSTAGSSPPPAASAQPATPAPSQQASSSSTVARPTPAAAVESQPSSSSSPTAPAQSAAPAQPGPLFPTPPPAPAPSSSSTPDSAPTPEPAAADPAPASQPQPEAAQPAPEPVRSTKKARVSWEAPVAGAHQSFLMELYGGYAFARFTSAGTSANLGGALGSFGWNLKPWLQIVGDSSYNLATTSGAKSVLYGNHFGGRVYYRNGRFGMGRRGLTPFVEALVGGSRVDTTLSGPGGYKTSVNCISYKAGGGIDFHFSPHWEVRLINVDYYRTTFGAAGYSAAQNNYWASAGVVFRLFGARSE